MRVHQLSQHSSDHDGGRRDDDVGASTDDGNGITDGGLSERCLYHGRLRNAKVVGLSEWLIEVAEDAESLRLGYACKRYRFLLWTALHPGTVRHNSGTRLRRSSTVLYSLPISLADVDPVAVKDDRIAVRRDGQHRYKVDQTCVTLFLVPITVVLFL